MQYRGEGGYKKRISGSRWGGGTKVFRKEEKMKTYKKAREMKSTDKKKNKQKKTQRQEAKIKRQGTTSEKP